MHFFRVSVERLLESGDRKPVVDPAEVVHFTISNHDDVLKIVERIREKGLVDADRAAALGVGLKLLSEIVEQERHNALFEPLVHPLRNFTSALKHS